jgi:hypothetical protein
MRGPRRKLSFRSWSSHQTNSTSPSGAFLQLRFTELPCGRGRRATSSACSSPWRRASPSCAPSRTGNLTRRLCAPPASPPPPRPCPENKSGRGREGEGEGGRGREGERERGRERIWPSLGSSTSRPLRSRRPCRPGQARPRGRPRAIRATSATSQGTASPLARSSPPPSRTNRTHLVPPFASTHGRGSFGVGAVPPPAPDLHRTGGGTPVARSLRAAPRVSNARPGLCALMLCALMP